MKLLTALCLVLLAAPVFPVAGAIIGTNVPARPLTRERIATLPAELQPTWQDYLNRSEQQMAADRAGLQQELQANGLTQPLLPPGGHSAKDLPLESPADWYASPAARQIADFVLSYQTPAGGWSKNLDMTRHRRAPGEAFATDNNNRLASPGDFDLARDLHWHYVGTFDNDATISQMRFLARVVSGGGTNQAVWQAAFRRGLDYVFHSQYPNGGWPQVWPLEGGYHDAITINDGAMLHVLELLHAVSLGRDDFAWLPAELRAQAAARYQRGMDCLLAAQIQDPRGYLTVWCQQHDALTLTPASARNYEMPAACSSESAEIVLFLMALPNPDARQQTAIRAAVAWFDQTKIIDQAYKLRGKSGRQLFSLPGNGPIWSRYYEIGTDRPIFGDRDRTLHDNVNDLSLERRNGYGWYRDTPKRVVEHFRSWSKKHPA